MKKPAGESGHHVGQTHHTAIQCPAHVSAQLITHQTNTLYRRLRRHPATALCRRCAGSAS